MNRPLAAGATALALALATPATAQTGSNGTADAEAPPAQVATPRDQSEATAETRLPQERFLSVELTGEPVVNADGEDLAVVRDFALGRDGRITHVLLAFGGFLGLGEKEVLLPFEVFAIEETEDGLTFSLAMSREDIEALPAFDHVQKDPPSAGIEAAATPPADEPAGDAPPAN